jgi:CrcB protein
MQAALLVALGGALGSLLRYFTQRGFSLLLPTFPLGTLLVNVIGSLAMGALLPVVDKWHANARPFLLVGVLGGLTTMSSFAGEVTLLLTEKRYLAAGLHWCGGAFVCVAACMVGMALVAE